MFASASRAAASSSASCPPPALFREVARRAEELGYDSLWAGDHVSFENPILDVTVALATFAAVTSRITIGAGIVLLPLRPPALVAKAFSSLDYLSGGRVVLGVGVGGEGPQDFEAVGVPVRERGARADEAMLVLRELFAHSPAELRGPLHPLRRRLDRATPRAAGWAAALGRRALARSAAARGPARRRLVADLDLARAVRRRLERDPPARGERGPRSRRARSRRRRPGARRRRRDAGARAHVRAYLGARYGTTFSPQAVERYCVAGTPEECAARVQAYVDGGRPSTSSSTRRSRPIGCSEQVERLADAVLAVAA